MRILLSTSFLSSCTLSKYLIWSGKSRGSFSVRFTLRLYFLSSPQKRNVAMPLMSFLYVGGLRVGCTWVGEREKKSELYTKM